MSLDPARLDDLTTGLPRALRAALCAWASAALLAAPVANAQQGIPIEPDPGGAAPVLSADTPIGPLEYRAGRGLRIGDTGLTVGGFSVVEIDDPEHGDATVALDSITFLTLYEPIDALRVFAEVEIGGLATYDADAGDVTHNAEAVVERLYAEWSRSDALNLRLGKFQTPIGRYNLVPAEPFVWTSADPITLDTAFDEHQTGAALFGTFYPGGNPLRYWLYGQMVDPFDSDSDAADRSAGGRLEYGGSLGDWSVGASLNASKKKGEWQYLAGLDAQLHVGALELTGEAVFSEGGIEDRDLWSAWLQGVFDLGVHVPFLRGVYLVGRFEHFDRDGHDNDLDVWDLGATWYPKPWLVLKAGYRLSDRITDDVEEGITASISVLF
ncbi:MAG TPA: hypothetical protein VKB65_02460 [Myxococcota bacterium]|nr:hypothetical protein [Myxococcota bacterium]